MSCGCHPLPPFTGFDWVPALAFFAPASPVHSFPGQSDSDGGGANGREEEKLFAMGWAGRLDFAPIKMNKNNLLFCQKKCPSMTVTAIFCRTYKYK